MSLVSNMSGSSAGNEIRSVDSRSEGNISDYFYGGYNALGWCIRLNSMTSLQIFVKRGALLSSAVDVVGTPCLHLAARLGNAALIDIILMADNKRRIEIENTHGNTAAMEGAAAGNFSSTRQLLRRGANARRALGITYSCAHTNAHTYSPVSYFLTTFYLQMENTGHGFWQ